LYYAILEHVKKIAAKLNYFKGIEKIALRKFKRLALKNEIMLPKPGFAISL